jgi:hypothetical protein
MKESFYTKQVYPVDSKRVLMKVYHTQNYWVFGLFPPSGFLGTRKHDVSETGSVSETSCFLVPRIPDDRKSKNPVILRCIQIS